MRRTHLLVAFGVVLIGCHTTTEPPIPSGSVSFSYIGAGATSATTYSASGPGTAFPCTEACVVPYGSLQGEIGLLASVPRTSTTSDIAEVSTFAAQRSVGSYAADPNCQASMCALVTFATASDGN